MFLFSNPECPGDKCATCSPASEADNAAMVCDTCVTEYEINKAECACKY